MTESELLDLPALSPDDVLKSEHPPSKNAAKWLAVGAKTDSTRVSACLTDSGGRNGIRGG